MGEESAHFSSEFFEFFRDLSRNNNREWFQANKGRYEAVVQEPCLRFIRDAGAALRSLSPHIVADARPFGGSLFRIYRDTRFSRDKSPYKTHAAMRFSHAKARGPEDATCGLYLHLESGESYGGGGVWHPDAASLKKIRDRIVAKPNEWRAVRRRKATLEGETLKRAPPGYDPDHPFALDLRRKDFVATVSFQDREVTSPTFLRDFLEACRSIDPLNRFVAKATGLPW